MINLAKIIKNLKKINNLNLNFESNYIGDHGLTYLSIGLEKLE